MRRMSSNEHISIFMQCINENLSMALTTFATLNISSIHKYNLNRAKIVRKNRFSLNKLKI